MKKDQFSKNIYLLADQLQEKTKQFDKNSKEFKMVTAYIEKQDIAKEALQVEESKADTYSRRLTDMELLLTMQKNYDGQDTQVKISRVTEEVYDIEMKKNFVEFTYMQSIFKQQIKSQTDEYMEQIEEKKKNVNSYENRYVKPPEIFSAQVYYVNNSSSEEDEDSKIFGVTAGKQIEKYSNTMRISSMTSILHLKNYCCDYWVLNKDNFDLYNKDFNSSILKQKSVSSYTTEKNLVFNLKNKTQVKRLNNFSEYDKDEGDGDLDKQVTFKSQFDNHFPNFSQFFDNKLALREHESRLKKQDYVKERNNGTEKSQMNDSHFVFRMIIIIMLITIGYMNMAFYEDSRSCVQGFQRLFDNLMENEGDSDTDGSKSIYSLNSTTSIVDYISFLSSPNYKEMYFVKGNFKFLGMMAIRTVRTAVKKCTISIPEDLSEFGCNYNKYHGTKKSYDPVYYMHEGVGKTLTYTSSSENKISSTAKGYFTPFDGSGFMMLLNQENDSDLKTYAGLFHSIKANYIKNNTKAVLINFNQNYSPTNVNVTATIMFEYSPLGNFVVHRSTIDLFVLRNDKHRLVQYLFEISLLFLQFLYMIQFFNIQIDIKRSEFTQYCFKNTIGVQNILYSILIIYKLIIFSLMHVAANKKQIEQSESQNSLYYYEDFAGYSYYYNQNQLLSVISLCIILLRVSHLITSTDKGKVIMSILDLVGPKAIISLMYFIGLNGSFTLIYMIFHGPYQQHLSTFNSTYQCLTLFTLRQNPFDDIKHFNILMLFIFYFTYLILITIVGCLSQTIFSDTVRTLFIYQKEDFIDITNQSVTITKIIEILVEKRKEFFQKRELKATAKKALMDK